MVNILLTVASGLLLSFAFPNFIEKGTTVHTAFFIWFAYVPLFVAMMKSAGIKQTFWHGFTTGMVFYLTSLYWLWFVKPMGYFAPVAWLLLGTHLSLFIAFSCAISKYFFQKRGIPYIFSLPVIFTAAEFIREWLFTGFQLLTPAQSQQQFTPLIAVLKLAGVHPLTYFIIFINVFIAGLVSMAKPWKEGFYANVSFGLVACIIIMIIAANAPRKAVDSKMIDVILLQRNVDQNVRWDANYRKMVFDITKTMSGASRTGGNPVLFIWPETGYPGAFNIEPEAGSMIALLTGKTAYNLLGSDAVKRQNKRVKYYNSVTLVRPDGSAAGEYSKYHLVPFGEYVPLQDVFPFIDKVVRRYGYESFSPGRTIEPMEIDGVKFGALVCYDGLFPEISREFSRKGATFIAHLSYESWYGNTQASAQIFTNTALRAVENNMYIARCVEAGISGIVDNKGRIIKSTGLFTRETLSATIPAGPGYGNTVYSRFGDWFVWFVLAVFTAALIIRKRAT